MLVILQYLILHIALFVDGTLLVRKNSNALRQRITEVPKVSCLYTHASSNYPFIAADESINQLKHHNNHLCFFLEVIITVFDMADIKTLEHTQ